MSLITAMPTKEEGKERKGPSKDKVPFGGHPDDRRGKKETAGWITRFGWMLEIVAPGRR